MTCTDTRESKRKKSSENKFKHEVKRAKLFGRRSNFFSFSLYALHLTMFSRRRRTQLVLLRNQPLRSIYAATRKYTHTYDENRRRCGIAAYKFNSSRPTTERRLVASFHYILNTLRLRIIRQPHV